MRNEDMVDGGWYGIKEDINVLEGCRDLGPVSPTQVNSNHQLAYFADQSDTTHVPHQPTTVA